jgi:hypothetical protein
MRNQRLFSIILDWNFVGFIEEIDGLGITQQYTVLYNRNRAYDPINPMHPH